MLDLIAIYRGGKCFHERIRRFLTQNEFETDDSYFRRLNSARYFNYIGPIIDRFAASLIQTPPSVKREDAGSVDEFWKSWQSNVDGAGTDLGELAREAITDAMMKRRTFYVVEKPRGTAETMAEWRASGLGDVRVRELETQNVLDWSCEKSGQLEWLTYYETERPRESPTVKRNRTIETWTVYTSQDVSVYQISYEDGNRPDTSTEAPLVDRYPHELGRPPIVVFDVFEGMWLAERAYDAQLEHFTQRAALNWALKMSCYAMPVFHLEDANVPPKMGTGRGLVVGQNDEVSYLAPPAAPFEVVADSVASCREEIYRIVHQMAEGISSKASATARSGDSKRADLIATNTILESYAVVLRDAISKIVDLVCAMRGEDSTVYSVGGLDEFEGVDLAALMESIEKANAIGMPSDTFQAKARGLILDNLMPQISEAERGKILEELSSGLAELKEKDAMEAQYQQALAHALAADQTKRQGKPSDAPGGNGGGFAADAKGPKAPAKPDASRAAKP